MSKLTTLQPRLKVIDTRRIKPVTGEILRVSGNTRLALKRRLYARDGGCCCMCARVVDLDESELDHRVALQFGGGNDESNMWTLCTGCHRAKSAREAALHAPDDEALQHDIRRDSNGVVTVI